MTPAGRLLSPRGMRASSASPPSPALHTVGSHDHVTDTRADEPSGQAWARGTRGGSEVPGPVRARTPVCGKPLPADPAAQPRAPHEVLK
jgi:hypothetical protein